MKKTILVLFAFLITRLVSAQILNFQAGTTFSKLNWDYNDPSFVSPYEDRLIGHSLFVGVEYFNKTHFSLSSNLGLYEKGGQEMVITNTTPMKLKKEKAKLNYTSINTMVNLKLPVSGIVTPYISAGPRLDYLVTSSSVFDSIDNVGTINKAVFGLLLGGGIKADFAKIQLGVQALYYANLDKIGSWTTMSNEGPYAPGLPNPDSYRGKITDQTFTINLTIGYKLK